MKSWPKDFWFLFSSLRKSNECQMFQWNVFISSTVVNLSQTATMHFIYYCTGVKRCSADLYESWRLFRLSPFNSERPIKQALRAGPCFLLKSYTLNSSGGATYFISWLSVSAPKLKGEENKCLISSCEIKKADQGLCIWEVHHWELVGYVDRIRVNSQRILWN